MQSGGDQDKRQDDSAEEDTSREQNPSSGDRSTWTVHGGSDTYVSQTHDQDEYQSQSYDEDQDQNQEYGQGQDQPQNFQSDVNEPPLDLEGWQTTAPQTTLWDCPIEEIWARIQDITIPGLGPFITDFVGIIRQEREIHDSLRYELREGQTGLSSADRNAEFHRMHDLIRTIDDYTHRLRILAKTFDQYHRGDILKDLGFDLEWCSSEYGPGRMLRDGIGDDIDVGIYYESDEDDEGDDQGDYIEGNSLKHPHIHKLTYQQARMTLVRNQRQTRISTWTTYQR